ncbi:MAG: oxygenase MpaB family protein [Dehalococcoidia bacterium]
MFDKASMLRRVNGESVLLLGGGRALLMQLAHPLVARGVAEHSHFEAAPLRRLVRTLRPVYAVGFGSAGQAAGAASTVRARHRGVVGAGYSALDPGLGMWVHATLVDSALVTYERFVRPLEARERTAYYLEMQRLGEMFGVPRASQPAGVAAFETYVASMVGTLDVSAEARRLAASVFATRPWELAPLTVASRWVTAGLLPPRLRAGYGLRWSSVDERLLSGVAATCRIGVPMLPRRLRRPPAFLMPREV